MGQRNVNTESSYDYGSRAGVWRLLRLFERAGLPLTVFAVGKALADNPEVGRAFARLGHEVASHHWRWIDYLDVPEAVEREHMLRSIEVIEQLTGSKPVGWYDSDVYDDDLPHWTTVDGQPQLLLPYAFDTNDFKFTISPGFTSGEDFELYLRRSFDYLYEEGADAPKMMSIGLHCRMAGRPGRAAALARFLEHVRSFDDVWVCRRADIAEHWYTHFPPEPG